ncbi:MAG: DoxX family protein [Bacteroidales bacterium]
MEAKKRISVSLGLVAVFISIILFQHYSHFEDATWTKMWMLLVMMSVASVGLTLIFNTKNYALHSARIFSGILFVFSGFVKTIDPLGSKYKFIDYFDAWGIGFLEPTALTFGILLSMIELVVGLMLLFKIYPKISTLLALLFMIGFTPVTLYLALQENITGSELVHDCGCFGDALILTNWQTFVKNLVILVPVIIIFMKRSQFSYITTRFKSGVMVGFFMLCSVGMSVYALEYLPPIDFRPYKVGTKLVSSNCTPGLKSAQEKVLYAEFIHKETGEHKLFNISTDYPQDTIWEYNIDEPVREEIVQKNDLDLDSLFPGQEIFRVDNFLFSKNSEERTCDIISDKGYVFLFVAYDIKSTETESMNHINDICEWAMNNDVKFYGATSSLDEEIEKFKKKTHAQFEMLDADDIPLKTIVRANPGLVLLKNGVVINKWHSNTLPSIEEFENEIIK